MGVVKHSSPNCVCGFNTAGDQYTDPICDPTAPPEGRVTRAPRPLRAQVRLALGQTGTGVFEVNGIDLARSTVGVDVQAKPGHLTEVTLHLLTHETSFEGEAVVTVPKATHDALVALGWTPPEGA